MPIVNLTARYVDAVKTASSRVEIRDAKIEGLELRVTRGGVKTWALRYRRRSDGTKRTHTLGRYPDTTLEEARRAAQEARWAVAKGGDPAAEKQARRVADTFNELAEEWIERHGKANKAPRSLKDDLSMLHTYVYPAIGEAKAGEIAKRDIVRLLDLVGSQVDSRRKNKKAATRKLTHRPNRVHALVRSIFRWGVGRDMISHDPTLGLAPPVARERERERELSPNEICIFWKALSRAPSARERWRREDGDFPMRRGTALTMKLSLVTGQRIGEISTIALTDLDLNEKAPIWTIPGSRTKNGKPHRVPLSPLAVQLITEARELAADSDWLFPSSNHCKPVDPHAATRALARARPMIGLQDFRVHDLRRTAATRMAEAGVSPDVIARVLNHVSASKGTITSKVYVQYSFDKEKREALDKWGACLERIIDRNASENVVPSPAPP